MKKQYYFKNESAELCHDKAYFLDIMAADEVEELTVIEAIPTKDPIFAWCKSEACVIELSEKTCGRDCKDYEPKNKKSGCCTFYSRGVYEFGEKITLTL